MKVLSVKNWDRFQHYKDRDPPWIKLYRDTLTTEAWVLGTDLSRLVQLAITLLAARYSNKIPLNFALLKRVMTLDCTAQSFTSAITHLVEQDFLEIHEVEDSRKQSAIKPIATCPSEGEAEGEKRQSRADSEWAAEQPGATKARRKASTEEPPEFADIRQAYPRRAGSQRWGDAVKHYRRRRAEGVMHEDILAGIKRYAAFLQSTGETGAKTVQQAATFLGDNRGYLEPWTPPPPPPRPLSAVERVRLANGVNRDDRVVAEQRNGSSFDDLDLLGGDVRQPVHQGIRRLGT